MPKTAVLIGGTFNPVTLAHMAMGRAVAKFLDQAELVADIYYVPSNMNYIAQWKSLEKDEVFNSDSRMIFLEKAMEELKDSRFKILDIEHRGIVDGRTVNTIGYVQEKLGYERVILTIGADKIKELPFWYEAEKIVQKAHILIFRRGNIELDGLNGDFWEKHKLSYTLLLDDIPDISSTMVRKMYAEGRFKEVKKLVSGKVWEQFDVPEAALE